MKFFFNPGLSDRFHAHVNAVVLMFVTQTACESLTCLSSMGRLQQLTTSTSTEVQKKSMMAKWR